MFTALQLEHYRSISKCSVELSNCNVFVGPNGSGKSNFVDALRLLRDAAAYGLDRAIADRHGINSIRQWSPSRPYHVTISVKVRSNRGYGAYKITLSSLKGTYRIIHESGTWSRPVRRRERLGLSQDNSLDNTSPLNVETMRFERDKVGRVEIRYQKGNDQDLFSTTQAEFADDTFLRSPYGQATSYDQGIVAILARTAGLLYDLRRTIADFEAYTIFPNTLRAPQTPTNEERLLSDGSNFTSVYRALSRNNAGQNARREILRSLSTFFPRLKDIRIDIAGGYLTPVFEVIEADDKSHDFNVSQISDGTLRLLGILTALYQPDAPSSLALEEPEQTVHPGVLAVVAEAIHDFSRRSQIFVTTHSPELVDRFSPNEIRAVALVEGSTFVSPVAENQKQAVIDGLFTLGEIMRFEGLNGQL
jgi:predicted ATPase